MRRWVLLTIVLALVYFAPALVALTPLRDLPLTMALEGMEGTIHSGGASFGWFSAVEYREIEVHDRAGERLLHIPALTIDRTTLQLVSDRSNFGTVTVSEPELRLIARRDGSNLEDVLMPWWDKPSGGPVQFDLVVANGKIALEDNVAREKFEILSLGASLGLSRDEAAAIAWSAAGKVAYANQSGTFNIASTDDAKDAVRLKADNVPLSMFRFLVARSYGDLKLRGQLTSDIAQRRVEAANEADAPQGNLASGSLDGQVRITDLFVSGGPLQSDEIRLKSLVVQGGVEVGQDVVRLKDVAVDCDVGRLNMEADLITSANSRTLSAEQLARQTYAVHGSLDLARLAQMLPGSLRIRPETQITAGFARLDVESRSSPEAHLWQASLKTEGLAATNNGKPIRLERPVALNVSARETDTGIAVDDLACSSDFVQITGKGTAHELSANLNFDLDQLKAQLGQLVDLGELQIAGQGRGQIQWQRDAAGAFRATATAELNRFELGQNPASVWREDHLTAELQIAGRMPAKVIEQLQSATLRAVATSRQENSDQVEIHLREAIADPGGLDRLPMLVHCSGNLAAWRSRLSPFVDLSKWELAGATDLHANVTWTPAACDLHSMKGAIQGFHAWTGEWFIDEPVVQFDFAGRYDTASRRIDITGATIESSTASLRSERASIALPTAGSLGLLGQVTFLADLEKLERWTHHPQNPPALVWSGQLNGRADLSRSGGETTARMEAKVDNFAANSIAPAASAARSSNPLRGAGVAAQPSRTRLWEEKQLALDISGAYSQSTDAVRLERLQVGSEALNFAAAGQITRLSDKAELSLDGTAEYDWETLSKLFAPYFGDNVRVTGRQRSDFAVRGPIGPVLGNSDGAHARSVAVSSPTAVAGKPVDSLAWIKPLSARAGVGWATADVFGMHLGRGEIGTELNNGLLQTKPIELAVSEGRVRLSPQITITPAPAELILGRGNAIENVRITPQMAASWVKFIAPAVADATQIEGRLSLDVQGAKVPLAQPAASDIAGKLEVHSLQVTPGPPARALILLAEQIRALVEKRPPPVELGRNPVLLSVSDQKVDFRMVEGRVHHQGMTMSVGDVTIRTNGWVALDESIALTAEVPIKPQWVERNPLLASLKDKTLQIPIGGTLRRPQVDPRAMQQVAGLLLKDAARDVLQDQLNKQLDRLFQPR